MPSWTCFRLNSCTFSDFTTFGCRNITVYVHTEDRKKESDWFCLPHSQCQVQLWWGVELEPAGLLSNCRDTIGHPCLKEHKKMDELILSLIRSSCSQCHPSTNMHGSLIEDVTFLSICALWLTGNHLRANAVLSPRSAVAPKQPWRGYLAENARVDWDFFFRRSIWRLGQITSSSS